MAANKAERGIQPTLLNASRYRPNTKSKMAAITNGAPAIMKGTDPCLDLETRTMEVLQLGIGALAGGEQLAHVAPVHADEVERPVAAVARKEAQDAGQESGVFGLVHLTRGHREFAMADRAEPADMAVDRHIVRRIGEDHGGPGLLHQDAIGRLVESAAAMNPVATEEPGVARPGYRRPGPDCQRHIVRIGFRRRRGPFDQEIDLGHIETGGLQAEIEIELGQLAQLLAEQAVAVIGISRSSI